MVRSVWLLEILGVRLLLRRIDSLWVVMVPVKRTLCVTKQMDVTNRDDWQTKDISDDIFWCLRHSAYSNIKVICHLHAPFEVIGWCTGIHVGTTSTNNSSHIPLPLPTKTIQRDHIISTMSTNDTETPNNDYSRRRSSFFVRARRSFFRYVVTWHLPYVYR